MNFITDIFKSQIRKDCERVFTFLEKDGFEKSFAVFGTESTLTYKKNDIRLTLMWYLSGENPWFLIQIKEKEISLEDLEPEIRNRYKFIKPGQQKFLNWAWKFMKRKEYLELIALQIKNAL
ncbi:MAG: hypothetical protein H6585_03500 [Flavobacteriales bacterium]|nr:hypothetical protein [Flavobacteriales bacterium]MCB9447393.1 hypothetical protein [Flavobacteriales bacterium]